MLFHLSFLLWSYLRQEDKCVLYSFMSTKMEVPLQSELTECLVNARHWLLCMGANLIGDMCWGLGSPSLAGKTCQLQIVFAMWCVQFSRSLMSDSLQPHGLQHARAHCSSPNPGAWANSRPSSWWFHQTISSSVLLFSCCLQSFSETGSFLMSQFFTSVGQSVGGSISASVLPMNIQVWFPLGWLSGSPCSPRDSQESCPTPQFKTINCSLLTIHYGTTVTSIYDNWKNHGFGYTEIFSKVMSLLLKNVYRFVIDFLQMSKHLLISWL